MKLGDEIEVFEEKYVCCPATEKLLGIADNKCSGCGLVIRDSPGVLDPLRICGLWLSKSFVNRARNDENCPKGCYFKKKR